jgi:2-dehydropantoate 2-reductase
MKHLVVGAGALGGYFGGRLLEAGCDVTFLLRPARAAAISAHGLIVRSPRGDMVLTSPPHVLASDIPGPFDVVIVACKAYDLDATMADFGPAVGPATAILPLLNGMRHLETLQARFGADRVLGGLCLISAVVDAEGVVHHVNELHSLTFGEIAGGSSPRVAAIAADFARANFDSNPSEQVVLEMWEKWIFIASAAGVTCLMRASIGDIVAAGAGAVGTTLLDECGRIATASGFSPRPASVERARAAITAAGSPMTASMLKDIERGSRIEADHIVGDLLARASADGPAPQMLRIVQAHLGAYEARRARHGLA